jgi:FkbM family methyltransferase
LAKVNLPPELNRWWYYTKYNLRDVYDSYLSPSLPPVKTPFGFSLGGSRSQHHVAMQGGTFDHHEVVLLQGLLADADALIDVGANIGYFACLARQMGKRAVAIEPLPANLKHLYANLRINGWSDTEVFPMAVSDKAGQLTLHGASSTGASLVSKWAGAPSLFQRTVAVSMLDRMAGSVPGRLVIKVDVEGHEYRTLLGARGLLDRTPRPRWFIEILLNEYHPTGANPDFASTFELFFERGYKVERLDDDKLVPITREDVQRWARDKKTGVRFFNYLFT